MIGKVLGAALGAAKEKHTGTSLLVVNGAHMQRTIAGRIAAVHVSTVEQQVFQVLDQAMPTGLQAGGITKLPKDAPRGLQGISKRVFLYF